MKNFTPCGSTAWSADVWAKCIIHDARGGPPCRPGNENVAECSPDKSPCDDQRFPRKAFATEFTEDTEFKTRSFPSLCVLCELCGKSNSCNDRADRLAVAQRL